MSGEVAPEDLLVLARQCKLSDREERRFELAVRTSRELKALYSAGVHFDDLASVLPGDEARFSRLVERTLAHVDTADSSVTPRIDQRLSPAAVRVSRVALMARYFAASLALGVLLMVTLASAWDYIEERAVQRAREASASTAANRKPTPTVPSPSLPKTVSPLMPANHPLASASDGQQRPLRMPAVSARRIAAAEEPPSLKELFASANEARRKGDIEAAIALYEQLIREYPNSLAAGDAKVLRGNLLLSQRSPRAALRQFQDYHSGALSLEALWGRVQALRTLGGPDEQAALLELVRDYPDSPYTKVAKKRLRELSR
jgi:TolA-binding protein